jgi:Clostripain family
MATESVSGDGSRKPKWTVMVFMGADSLPHEADLYSFAQEDIDELRDAVKKSGTNDAFDVFVQLHAKGVVTREHVGKGPPQDVAAEEGTLTDGTALTAFIGRALEAASHQRGDLTMLVLWGHAYRFEVGRAAAPTGIDALDFAELSGVLRRFQEEMRIRYNLHEAPRLDVVGFDACDLATLEVAYQLYPFAKYLLASQIGIPLPGWPYDRIFERIRSPFGRVMGPAELGSYVVRRYCESYLAEEAVSLSLLDLDQAPVLFELTEALARRLAIALDDDLDERKLVSELFRRSQTLEDRPYVDVADLCLNLLRYSTDTAVKQVAEALGNLLMSPKPIVEGHSETGAGRPFIAENGRNACQLTRLHGISLYAPNVADGHDFEGLSPFYDKFAFAQESLWRDLVGALALPS